MCSNIQDWGEHIVMKESEVFREIMIKNLANKCSSLLSDGR